MKKIGVALLGLGTVGSGTYRILKSQHDNIMNNYGVDIEIRHILEKDMTKVNALNIDPSIVSCDINNILNDDKISIVAEFFGGIEPARSFLIKSLEKGKSIVTANKELFSKHWAELEAAASLTGAGLYFEASCVGGVPIIRALQDSCQGNNITCLKGIVNGTTNYILTQMTDNGANYSDALKEAQRLGYAEANPTADVDGYDSSYKLSILSTLAYGKKVPLSKVYCEGISKIDIEDINYGKRFGLTIKLLAISKNNNGNIEAHVYPAFIPNEHPLASVKGSFNAVYVTGNNVGDLMFYGRGAGDLPTGSAIVSDIVYAATKAEHRRFPYALDEAFLDSDFNTNFSCEYFIRLNAVDSVGVLSKISGIFAQNGISITTMYQQADKGGICELIFITHITNEEALEKAMNTIKVLDCVAGVSSVLRVER
ncbi:MAG: homoserine dehydrogenase [Clostridia bacterium]|nr:homoserine dehydrogenase [Clostridia bacterium]